VLAEAKSGLPQQAWETRRWFKERELERVHKKESEYNKKLHMEGPGGDQTAGEKLYMPTLLKKSSAEKGDEKKPKKKKAMGKEGRLRPRNGKNSEETTCLFAQGEAKDAH